MFFGVANEKPGTCVPGFLCVTLHLVRYSYRALSDMNKGRQAASTVDPVAAAPFPKTVVYSGNVGSAVIDGARSTCKSDQE